MHTSIAVVIPTHNRLKELKAAVDSVLYQTVPPDELIVVDDGSVPKIEDNIFTCAPNNHTVCKLIRNSVSRGGNSARNTGIRNAKSDFIAFLDDDDEFKVDKIEILIKSISNDAIADVYYHPAEIHMLKENITYLSRPKKFQKGEDVLRSLLISNKIGGTPMVMVKKATLLNVGLFDESLPAQQDYELWLRLAKNKAIFQLIDKPLTKYHYVTGKKSISKSIEINKKASEIIEKKYRYDYECLSKKEKGQYNEWKRNKMVHKSLLNCQTFNAFYFQLIQTFFHPKIKNVLALIAILAGPKFVYRMKARFG